MKHERAFTLIELMITLAIAALLLSLATPAMRDLVQNNRLTAATNNFRSTLNLVRSEAVKRGRNAFLCVSSDQAACTGETDWRLGWIAWVDDNANGVLDAGETLRIVEALPASISVTPSQAVSSLRVDATGVVDTPNVRLTLCDDRSGETGRQLRIMATGGVSLDSQYACG